jgi:hypothetical protein
MGWTRERRRGLTCFQQGVVEFGIVRISVLSLLLLGDGHGHGNDDDNEKDYA